MSFFARIAKAAAKHAPADLDDDQDLEDPHAEPPAGGLVQHTAEDLDAERCPDWVWRLFNNETEWGVQERPWPADVAPLVEAIASGELGPEDLPPSPFKLQPWVTIEHGGRWLADIRRELEGGTLGARARLGVLQEDLRYLALRLRGDPTAAELEAARNGPSFG